MDIFWLAIGVLIIVANILALLAGRKRIVLKNQKHL